MLPLTHIQEGISRAYIKAICNSAGFLISVDETDFGLDVTVKNVEVREKQNGSFRYNPTGHNIDIQIKSTTNLREDGEFIVYDLENKAYNDLRRVGSTATKRILVLLDLPKTRDDWISQCSESLMIKKCAFWLSLDGLPEVPDNNSRTAIRISKKNIFSGDVLNDLIKRIKEGRQLTDV